MTFEGYIDIATETEIHGWVYDRSDPDRPLKVEIFDNGTCIAVVEADLYGQDLHENGKGNGRHRFFYRLPDNRKSAEELRARVAGQKWYILRSGVKNQGVPTFYAQYQHTMEFGLPDVPYGFTETPKASSADTALAERLIRAWHAAQDGDPSPSRKADIWTENERLFHGSFTDLLLRRDASGLAEYLRELYARPITHGIYQGEEATAGLASDDGSAYFAVALFMDYLASLAEAVGVLPVECAEQYGRYGENLLSDPDELVDKISAALGFSIIPPVVGGRMFGIRTRQGIVHARDLWAVWSALRLHAIASDGDLRSVCEIGGGVGNVAYFAWQLGLRDYTIVDLPNICVVQGWYLARALPNARIVLQGEADGGGEAIRLLPAWRFRQLRRHGVLFNQDSFPEMHFAVSTAYLDQARDKAKYLLSINQEAGAPHPGVGRQPVVHDLVRHVGGYRSVYRFPHWLRRGYVEELYAITPRPVREKLAHRLGMLLR